MAAPTQHQIRLYDTVSGSVVWTIGNGTAWAMPPGANALDAASTLRDPVSVAATMLVDGTRLVMWTENPNWAGGQEGRVAYAWPNGTVGTIAVNGGSARFHGLTVMWRSRFGDAPPPNTPPILFAAVLLHPSAQWEMWRWMPDTAGFPISTHAVLTNGISSLVPLQSACGISMCVVSSTPPSNGAVTVWSFNPMAGGPQAMNTWFVSSTPPVAGSPPEVSQLVGSFAVNSPSVLFAGNVTAMVPAPSGDAVYLTDGWAIYEITLTGGPTQRLTIAAGNVTGQLGADGPLTSGQRQDVYGSVAGPTRMTGVRALAAAPAPAPPGVPNPPPPATTLQLFATQGGQQLRRLTSPSGWYMTPQLGQCDAPTRDFTCQPQGVWRDGPGLACRICSVCGVGESEVSPCSGSTDTACRRMCGRRRVTELTESAWAAVPGPTTSGGVTGLVDFAIGHMVPVDSNTVLVGTDVDVPSPRRNLLLNVKLNALHATPHVGAENTPGDPAPNQPLAAVRFNLITATANRPARPPSFTFWSPGTDAYFWNGGARGDAFLTGDTLIADYNGTGTSVWGLGPGSTYALLPHVPGLKVVSMATHRAPATQPPGNEILLLAGWQGSTLWLQRLTFHAGNGSWIGYDPAVIALCTGCTALAGQPIAHIAVMAVPENYGMAPPPPGTGFPPSPAASTVNVVIARDTGSGSTQVGL